MNVKSAELEPILDELFTLMNKASYIVSNSLFNWINCIFETPGVRKVMP